MLDINRLLGFVFHSSSPVMVKAIKEGLMQLTPSLDADDVSIIQGHYCQGPGESTASVANAEKLAGEVDFVGMTKAVVKSIGEATINSPKAIFLICDRLSSEIDHTFSKMVRLNRAYDYESILHFLILNKHLACQGIKTPCTILDDVAAMVEEVRRILEEMDASRRDRPVSDE